MDKVNKKAMRSLAKKPQGPAEASQGEPYYLSISIEEGVLPELKGSDIGDKLYILVEAEVKGINKYGDGSTTYNLDLLSGDVVEEINNEEEE